jgi:hypothetical protein
MTKFRVINTDEFNPMSSKPVEAVDFKHAAGIAKAMLTKSARKVGERMWFATVEIYPENVHQLLVSNDLTGTLRWWDDAKIDDAVMYKGELSYIATAMRNAINELKAG